MEIDKRILKDSFFIKELALSQLRLYKDGDLDWFLLVPKRENVVDWTDLNESDQLSLTKEINFVCQLLKKYSKPDKINIGSLGNMVPQMHVHIIGRMKDDRAWPAAIWGTKSRKNYQPYMAEQWSRRLN
jgi:diadenosine tetraphosphate (Ap4A) HIT family hydrolase